MGRFYDKKTEYIIVGPFGRRRIWEDDEGCYYLLNNIRVRDVIWPYASDDVKVFPSKTVNYTEKR